MKHGEDDNVGFGCSSVGVDGVGHTVVLGHTELYPV